MKKLKTITIGRIKFLITVPDVDFLIKGFVLIFFTYIFGLTIHQIFTRPEELMEFVTIHQQNFLLILAIIMIILGLWIIKNSLKKK